MAALTASPAPSSAAPALTPTPALSTDTGANEGLVAALAARAGVDAASRSVSREALDGVLPALTPAAPAAAVEAAPVAVAPPAPPAPPAPAAPASPPVAAAPAPIGVDTRTYAAAGASRGLGANARAVYSAIRAQFGITNIGGYRAGGGDHGAGKACDVMTSNRAVGDAVAAYAIAHARELKIKYVIWRQRIYMMDRPGWRMMEDRGGATANHYDHVHISVY